MGYRVAICEQVQDPKLAKGLVDRKITELITPGTAIQQGLVHLPKEADWLENFRREVANFPNGRYDDQVDSMWLFLFGVRYRFQGARPPHWT
jgi:hypothetical protein